MSANVKGLNKSSHLVGWFVGSLRHGNNEKMLVNNGNKGINLE